MRACLSNSCCRYAESIISYSHSVNNWYLPFISDGTNTYKGFVGTKCRNSEAVSLLTKPSVSLAWAGFVPIWHRCVAPKSPILRQETKIAKQGFVLAFRKTRVQILLCVLLNASVLLALRPLRTSNSNDMRLVALCFVVIAKKDR